MSATLPETEFQAKVLQGVGEVKGQFETLEKNFQSIDAESKKLASDFASHVKSFEGMPSQVADITRSLQSIQLKIANERRANFGSGIERIAADENCRNAVNGMIRLAAQRA